MIKDMEQQRQHHHKMVENMTRLIHEFRSRWRPTGMDAPYHDRDFDMGLDRLITTVAMTYQQPILDSLSNAAAIGLSSYMPSVTLNGAKP